MPFRSEDQRKAVFAKGRGRDSSRGWRVPLSNARGSTFDSELFYELVPYALRDLPNAEFDSVLDAAKPILVATPRRALRRNPLDLQNRLATAIERKAGIPAVQAELLAGRVVQEAAKVDLLQALEALHREPRGTLFDLGVSNAWDHLFWKIRRGSNFQECRRSKGELLAKDVLSKLSLDDRNYKLGVRRAYSAFEQAYRTVI